MHSTYDYWLVALSLVVATLASYTALDLSSHISVLTRPRLRHAWLAGGAAAMGIGIWSMHFIGMLPDGRQQDFKNGERKDRPC